MFSRFTPIVLLFVSLILISNLTAISGNEVGKLTVGFYSYSCPHAEIIVREAVNKAVSMNPGIGAGIIRMHFHDCFVRGCDASILLDTVPGKPAAEKDNPVNFPSLTGFEVIDMAKSLIEAVCPKTVSCADILAFASRDSALKLGNINYDVPSGRRDGLVSLFPEVFQNLPPPSLNASALRDSFKRKGLSLDEMVTLSGAHSIGISHCSSFLSRLSSPIDPSLDPGFASFLKKKCPNITGSDPEVNNDIQTPTCLDNKYFDNLKYHKGLLTSDQTLFDSPLTKKLVIDNINYGAVWAKKFGDATVHMGSIGVLTGEQGEIRKHCRFVNS